MYEIYVVQQGDTLENIASKYNIDPSVIYQLNGFGPDFVLNVGSSIILPVRRVSNFEYYTIKKGDSLYSIAKQFNTNVEVLARLNGLNTADYIYPNQTIVVPKQGTKLYFTKENETLADVSNKVQTDVMDILSKNEKIYLVPEQIIIY